jgi:hypothetical protein
MGKRKGTGTDLELIRGIGDAEARGIVDRARTYLRRGPGGNFSAANAQALGQVAGEVERIKAEETGAKRNITAAGGKADLLAGAGGRTAPPLHPRRRLPWASA